MKNIYVFIFALATTMVFSAGLVSATQHCLDTGTGMSANYINEVPDEHFTVTCDVGIFYNESGVITDASLAGTVADAQSVQIGIYVYQADVDVRNSAISVEENYPHQFVSIRYDDATGTIRGNTLEGAHRAGIVARGDQTDVTIHGNSVIGTGAKTSGWAENGIQVDQGAVATIRNNHVEGHWWDGESNWASSGIMLFDSDKSSAIGNTLVDNEVSFYIIGDDNKLRANRITSSIVSDSSLEFRAWGAIVLGDRNDLAGNRFIETNNNGAVGIYELGERNKLTGNQIRGFEEPVLSYGTDALVRGNPSSLE